MPKKTRYWVRHVWKKDKKISDEFNHVTYFRQTEKTCLSAILAQTSRTIHSLSFYNSSIMPQILWPAIICPLVLLAIYFFIIVPFCIRVANDCHFTKDLLRNGWTPVLSAMIISSLGGKFDHILSKNN